MNGAGKSKYETQLFKYFITALSEQIQQLKLNRKRYADLPEEFRQRVDSFESYIAEAQSGKV